MSVLSLLGAPIMVVAQNAQRLPLVGVRTGEPDVRRTTIGPVSRGLRELGYVEGKDFPLEFRLTRFYVAQTPAMGITIPQAPRLRADEVIQ